MAGGIIGPILLMLGLARTVFVYIEEHVLYIEHWMWATFWGKSKELSRALAAMGARVVGRPVQLALPRQAMFSMVGYRTPTIQRIRLAAERDTPGHEVVYIASPDNHANRPLSLIPNASSTAARRPIVAIVPRSRYLNGLALRPSRRALITRATWWAITPATRIAPSTSAASHGRATAFSTSRSAAARACGCASRRDPPARETRGPTRRRHRSPAC